MAERELRLDTSTVIELGFDAALAISFENGTTPEELVRYLGALADNATVEDAIMHAADGAELAVSIG